VAGLAEVAATARGVIASASADPSGAVTLGCGDGGAGRSASVPTSISHEDFGGAAGQGKRFQPIRHELKVEG